jgi:uncharacterized protein (DUF1684 family)
MVICKVGGLICVYEKILFYKGLIMWQLIKVQHTDWIQDDSGYYTLINWIDDNNIRLDWMNADDMPVISFQGKASDVRKHATRWMVLTQHLEHKEVYEFSHEHAAYIGAELARCELLGKNYIQD